MTPRQYKNYIKEERKLREEKAQRQAEVWHVPLISPLNSSILNRTLTEMNDFKLNQGDVPLIIRLVENPDYKTSKLFTGAVDLFTHDCIHIILGRGLLVKDEAFVIGYTMGSSKKMKRWRRNLFMFCAKYLYPEGYSFKEEERFVFNMGVMAGSRCSTDLSKVDFNKFKNERISRIRTQLSIDLDLLKCYYKVEKICFPDSKESQRLI